MSGFVREHVAAFAGVLAIASLAVVFAAALGVVPAALPRAPDTVLSTIPHVNAAVSLLAIVTIGSGWRAIRRGRIRRHRTLMLVSFVLFGVFLALYLYKVILEGPAPFPGPRTVYRFVYLPLLIGHVGLAMITLPLLYYVLLLGLTRPPAAIRTTLHPRVGRVAAALWLVSFALGIVVYLMLYIFY